MSDLLNQIGKQLPAPLTRASLAAEVRRAAAPVLNLRPIPAWLLNPYADRSSCWGCGLEADIMIPLGCLLCQWCEQLWEVWSARAGARERR